MGMLGNYTSKSDANQGWNRELKSWVEAHQIIGVPTPIPLSFTTPAALIGFMNPAAPDGTAFATAIQAHVCTTSILIDSQPGTTLSITAAIPTVPLYLMLFSAGNSATALDIKDKFYQWIKGIAITAVDSVGPVSYPCTITEI